jgi:hypothetical protein
VAAAAADAAFESRTSKIAQRHADFWKQAILEAATAANTNTDYLDMSVSSPVTLVRRAQEFIDNSGSTLVHISELGGPSLSNALPDVAPDCIRRIPAASAPPSRGSFYSCGATPACQLLRNGKLPLFSAVSATLSGQSPAGCRRREFRIGFCWCCQFDPASA